MRIGIDARFWEETGVGRYVRNLVSNITEIDKKNEYVLFLKAPEYEKLTFPKNVKKVPVDIRWHSLREQLIFKKIIEQENLDLMHFTYFSLPVFYSRPFIVTIHDLILHHFPTGEASLLPGFLYRQKHNGYKFVMQQAAKKARKIIAVSQATKNEIVDHLHVSHKRIEVIYEGYDQKVSGGKKSPESFPYFLHVGNVYPHKNANFLIDSFIRIAGKIPQHLIFVGKDDFFMKRIKKYVEEQKFSERIHFAGFVSDEALSSYYSHATAVVIPSLMEGFGLPAVEAMANKSLVIASDISSLKEICQTAAIYFNPYNEDDLADKLLLSTTPKNNHAKNIATGYDIAHSFSWEENATKTLTVYENCIGV